MHIDVVFSNNAYLPTMITTLFKSENNTSPAKHEYQSNRHQMTEAHVHRHD